MRGRNLDGQNNATLVNGADVSSILNIGNAGGSILPATGTKPKFVVATSGGTRFGSVQFAGGDRLVLNLQGSLGPNATVLVIVKRTGSGANCSFVDGSGASNRMNVGENNVGGVGLFAGGSVTAGSGTTTNKYNVVVARFNGASSSITLNGLVFYDQNPLASGDAGSQTTSSITIGSAYDGSSPCIGEIVEVIVWASAVTAQSIQDYLDQEYSTGWPKTALNHFQLLSIPTPNLTIQTGDVVVPLGDSITFGSANQGGVPWYNPYKTWVQAGISGTTWFNAGVSGNTAAQMRARIATDVVPHAPKVVLVSNGTNDAFLRVDIGDYIVTNQGIVDDLKAALPGVKIACVGTMCRGEFYPDPSNIQWGAYSLALNKVANDNGLPFIDTRTAELSYESVHNTPPPGTAIDELTVDGEHLSTIGINLWSGLAQTKTVLAA